MALALASALAAAGCSASGDRDGGGPRAASTTAGPTSAPTATATSSPGPTTPTPAVEEICGRIGPAEVLGNVEPADLVEISGVAASRQNPGVLWVHNDSGGTPTVYALATDGRLLASYRLSGAEAVDWEDIDVGPGPVDGRAYLYVADIGDNESRRGGVTVYRVAEPEVDAGQPAAGAGVLTGVDTLSLTYADGPHDAETLIVDPVSAALVVATREWEGGPTKVFATAGGPPGDRAATLELVTEVDLTDLGQLATGGDVSPGGRLIVLRTYPNVMLWSRETGSEVWEAFAGDPCVGPRPNEQQGEAVAIAPDGSGYYTISEGEHPPVNFFPFPEPITP